MRKLILLTILAFLLYSLSVVAGEFKVTLISPLSQDWTNNRDSQIDFSVNSNNTVFFNLTVEGNHSGYTCNIFQGWNLSRINVSDHYNRQFYFNNTFLNGSGISPQGHPITNEYNKSGASVIEIVNDTFGGVWLQVPETNVSGFSWNAKCFNHTNDQNESAFASANFSMLYDIIYGIPIGGSALIWDHISGWPVVNNISDRRPELRWDSMNDTNFFKYTVYIDDSLNFGSVEFSSDITTLTYVNISLNSTFNNNSNMSNFTVLTNLLFKTYYWGVNFTDLAGNVNVSKSMLDASDLFTIDETCSILYSGWNLCGIVREGGVTASQIFNETGASQISIINTSAIGSFASYISASVSQEFKINEGQVAFIFVSSQTDWPNRVWNINNESRLGIQEFTNTSTESLNTFMIPARRGLNFQELDFYFSDSTNRADGVGSGWNTTTNSVIPFQSYYNNSAGTSKRFLPYFNNVTLNNDTRFAYGTSIWVSLANNSYKINRSEFK